MGRISPGLYPDRSNGAGKSFITSHQACMYGFKVRYYPSSKLFAHLKLSRADRSYLKELTKIQKLDVIILEPLDAQNRLTLLEILEDRASVFVSSFLYPAGRKLSVIQLSQMLSVIGLFTMHIE
jgi:hypothetical protein